MNVTRKPVHSPSALYLEPLSLVGMDRWLDNCFGQARDQISPHKPSRIFFRADDVAIPDTNILRLMRLFQTYRIPLALAVIPAWMTPDRWTAFQEMDRNSPDLWMWHTHGWRHVNHEPDGKKQEFGPSRMTDMLTSDLENGLKRLARILSDRLTRVFTPPWNRCDDRTMSHLKRLGYVAISRYRNSLPTVPPGIVDIPVNVDLHTRREPIPLDGWHALGLELLQGLVSGQCGVMIHHTRMDDAAFVFLDRLLSRVNKSDWLRPVHLYPPIQFSE